MPSRSQSVSALYMHCLGIWQSCGTFATCTLELGGRNVLKEDSDEDLLTVPDVESGPSSSAGQQQQQAAELQQQHSTSSGHGEGPPKNRKGRNPADREYRRLKRLLRNRVSAQQARERKKVYVNDLESRAEELNDKNLKLEEKISTLINENTMLRKVLMNTRPKGDKSSEQQNDQSGNS